MSQLSGSSIAIIEAATGWRQDRVQPFDLPEGRVIVKAHRPVRGAWRYRLLSLLAASLKAPYLRAVPMHGGAWSQQIELRRLAALKQAGVPVADVLHVADDYFVMSYLGADCLGTLINMGHPDAYALWHKACLALVATHAAGQYMSQCFGRNVIVDQDLRGFIDFEDDPLEVLTLRQAQVRDWVIFLHSTLARLQVSCDQIDRAIANVLATEHPQVIDDLRALAVSIGWLRHLPSRPWVLKRDIHRVQAASRALHRWATQIHPSDL